MADMMRKYLPGFTRSMPQRESVITLSMTLNNQTSIFSVSQSLLHCYFTNNYACNSFIFIFIFVYFSAYIKHTGGFNHKSMQTLLGSSPQTKNCQIRELTHNTQGVTLCDRRFCSASQMDAYHNRDTIFCQKFWNHDHACQKIVDL